MKLETLFVFLSWIVLYVASTSSVPGVVVRVNDKGLQYVDDVGVPILIEKLKTTTIKDISGEADTPVGSIDYEIKNLHNTQASISSSTFKTVPNVGLNLEATGINVAFNGDWHYRKTHWPHISDSGSFDMSASGLSFSLSVKLGEEKGHPTISTASCSANINDVHVDFHGGASWLYNLFKGKIEDILTDQLKRLICAQATKAINENAEQELATFPVRRQLDKFSIIDYSFIEPPSFTETYLNVSLKGQFLSAVYPNETTSVSPNEIPGNQPCNKMICIYLTDYVGNTAGEVYHKAGFFNTTLHASQVPKSFPFQLNTTLFIGLLLKRLYDEYPNRPLELVIYSTKPPTMNTQPSGITVVLYGNIEIYVVLKDNSTKYLFTLATNISAAGDVSVNGTVVQGALSKANVEFSVVKSDVGDIKPNIGLLNIMLNVFAEKTVISELNKRGKRGLPLPVFDNVHLVNTEVTFGKHFITLDTDMKFLPAHMRNVILMNYIY